MSKKKPIEIQINDKIVVEPDSIYKSKVIRSGNGAVINSFKRYIGKEVIVVVVNKIKKRKRKDDGLDDDLQLGSDIYEANKKEIDRL